MDGFTYCACKKQQATLSICIPSKFSAIALDVFRVMLLKNPSDNMYHNDEKNFDLVSSVMQTGQVLKPVIKGRGYVPLPAEEK